MIVKGDPAVPLKKILIANRGEIACRILRTCRKLGVATVAIYSEPDRAAQHVLQADEAYLLGGSTARESYLNGQKIIEIAQKSGAQAIHPGYGFLSENADFADMVVAAGLVFIGPKPHIIRQLGDKLTAKTIAQKEKVPLVPGTEQAIDHADDVLNFAKTHGYPLLLKAAAGGGGKGMRVVYTAAEIAPALERAKSEALSSFKDGRVFVEKYIENPRHIEIQVLGDKYGNVIHLGERDCSLQRRHQKVIEETPSPFITPSVRSEMIASALHLARAVGYDSAGTVEFIVSPDQSYYFLEMNTRLQVEHPITEMTTGVDLVAEMIHIAAGNPLRYAQDDIQFSGHAIEARLYAEDPERDFMPSSGRLVRCRLPAPMPIMRVDAGIVEGDVVSIFYDPMLAKIITHGANRAQALSMLSEALGQTIVEGVDHNAAFLQQLSALSNVEEGDYHTHTIENFMKEPAGWGKLTAFQQQIFLALSLSVQTHLEPHNRPFPHEMTVGVGDLSFPMTIIAPGVFQVKGGASRTIFTTAFTWLYARRVFSCRVNDRLIVGQVEPLRYGFRLQLFGHAIDIIVARPHIWALLQYVPKQKKTVDLRSLRSPMPGLLIALPIAVGDRVKKGQTLAVIEAMKMENALKAPSEAVVTDILVKHGDSLSRDQVIAKFA